MKIQRLQCEQLIKTDIETAWKFFSSPQNLSKITPEYLGFNITSPFIKPEMYAGQIITYTVRPLLNIPLYWMTEITQVKRLEFFIDEQRRGPYKLWHHQHHFEETKEGVLMTDIVHYQISELMLGSIVHPLFVKKQLKDIFDFRFEKVDEFFNNAKFNDTLKRKYNLSKAASV